MDHRAILDAAFHGLPTERAAYLAKVADRLQQRPDLEDRRHLLYPVVAAAAPSLEPMIDPERLSALAAAFIQAQGEGVAATVYGQTYLADPARALRPWVDRFLAMVAAEILDGLAKGSISVAERTVWRFGSDGTVPPFFPYRDDD